MAARRTGSPTIDVAAPDRRQEIVDACIRVLARRGFSRTRMSDIADELGVTAPLLLHYFDSKNELITTALVTFDEPYLVAMLEAFRSGTPPQQLLVTYVEDSIWPPTEGQRWWRQASAIWMNAWITSLHDPSIAQARAAEDRRWRQALTKIVRKGQADGAFRADVDAAAFVKTLFALMDGFLVQIALKDPGVTPRFAHNASFRFLSRELRFDPRRFSSRR